MSGPTGGGSALKFSAAAAIAWKWRETAHGKDAGREGEREADDATATSAK